VKLVWTQQAEEDRRLIFAYISEDDEDAAEKMDSLFTRKAESLLSFPEMGKPGRVAGTREFIAHKHYLLIYQVYGDIVEITAILHTSRQWPPVVGDETDE
jgi:addiction module RelE/StbE family toxin